MTLAQATQTLHIRFGRPDTRVSHGPEGLTVDLNLPHLAGPAEEWLAVQGAAVEMPEPSQFLLRGPDGVAGVLVEPCSVTTLEDVTRRMYSRLLDSLGGHTLYRIWNYVPQINHVEGGLENYHRFNVGRWRAFQEHFGSDLQGKLPAASAVGMADSSLVTLFAAGRDPAICLENPEQTPAWTYPERYGPKSPSFSRGTLRQRAGGPQAFISGTASIKGHETIGSDDLRLQCAVTCNNLRLISERMGIPDPFGPDAPAWKARVYLRHAADFPQVCAHLCEHGAERLAESATFLRCDICRPCLDVEIELTGV
ncbi:MAG: hypothetical protein KA004_09265 [Verrucomicrobiales bacterium]|nr:hypothetical protein [Verrucomicrobiales bacterium]